MVLRDQGKEPPSSAQVVGMTPIQLFSQLPLKWQSSKTGTKDAGRGESAKSVFSFSWPINKTHFREVSIYSGSQSDLRAQKYRKIKEFLKNIFHSSVSTLTTVTEIKEHSLWYCQQRF